MATENSMQLINISKMCDQNQEDRHWTATVDEVCSGFMDSVL